MQYEKVNPEESIKRVGKRVKQLRQQKGFTQKKLALDCDWDISTLQRLERGVVNSTLKSLFVICNALDVSLSEFFSGVPIFGETNTKQKSTTDN